MKTTKFFAFVFLFFVIGVMAVVVRPENDNITLLLDFARRVIENGERLYVDIMEPNPPFIIWWSMLSVFLGRWAGADPYGVNIVLTSALIAVATLLSWRAVLLLDGRVAFQILGCLLVSLACAATVIPQTNFGDRDHLMGVSFLPYALLTIACAFGRRSSNCLATLVGISAGVGIALKPFFILPLVAIEFWLLVISRRWCWFIRTETGIVVATVSCLWGIVFIFTPEYSGVVRMAQSYWFTYYLEQIIREYVAVKIAVGSVVIAVLLSIRSSREEWLVLSGLSVLVLGFLVTALVQGKGFSYHFVPTTSASVILFATSIGIAWQRWYSDSREIATVLGGGLLVCALSGVFLADKEKKEWRETPQGFFASFLKNHAVGKRVVFISSSMHESYPGIYLARANLASPYPFLWFIQSFYEKEYTGGRFKCHSPSEMNEKEARLYRMLMAELVTKPPDFVFVPLLREGLNWFDRAFPYEEYLLGDPRFKNLWVSYIHVGDVHGHRIWMRSQGHNQGLLDSIRKEVEVSSFR